MNVLSRETLLLGLICSADLVLTAVLISTGHFTEGNPILAHYLEYGLGMMCLVKLGSYVVPLALAEWYRQYRPDFVARLLRVTLCLYVVGYVTGIFFVNIKHIM
ncbi:MAG: hypothetical protein KY468_07175 [Armatimonadetes bacterium]|nr:hypothetical protein [Armatimonadota bacterium]